MTKLQVFYDTKARAAEMELKPVEVERLSPPRSIGRAPRSRWNRGDYAVSHDVELTGG